MRITTLPRTSLREVLAAVESAPRTPGVHVSDLTRAVMEVIDPEKYRASYDPDDQDNWWETGFLWEEVLSRMLAARQGGWLQTRQEIELENVIGTPDGIDHDADGVLLCESKLTWKSGKDWMDPATVQTALDSKKFLAWKLQILAYCYMLGLTRCRLFVLWINGTYDKYIPEFGEYLLEFDQYEIDENWTMLLNRGRKKGWL